MFLRVLILFFLSVSTLVAAPKHKFLICSCGVPVFIGQIKNGESYIVPSSVIEEDTMNRLRPLCKEPSNITVWHTERLSGKVCPISIKH